MKAFNLHALFGKIKKNKKYYWPAFAAILIIIVLVITWRVGRHTTEVDTVQVENVSGTGTQTQSYLVAQEPLINSEDKIFGSEKAPLKIFVYEDYTNSYSAVLADTLDKIQAESGNKLALVVRPFVLENSPLGTLAATAVDCAAAQGKWREMRALLFVKAKNMQAANADFDSYAQQIGLNQTDFQSCLTNKEKSGRIEKVVAEAKNYSVQGAPTMFVGEDLILGARPYDDFTDSNGDKIEGLKNVIARKLNNQ